MSDEEVEKFEITDHDLDNEFNINRPRARFSKHQQIYGIWADESSEDEGTTFKATKKPKNYTAPIGFVAGGVQQAGKKDDKKKKAEDDEEEEDEDEDKTGRRRMAGLSVSSSESEDERPSSMKRESFHTSGKFYYADLTFIQDLVYLMPFRKQW